MSTRGRARMYRALDASLLRASARLADVVPQGWPDIHDDDQIEASRELLRKGRCGSSPGSPTSAASGAGDTADGTLLTFTTWFGEDDPAMAAGAGYHVCLDQLIELLDTGAVAPLVDADVASWESRYGLAAKQAAESTT